MGKVAIVIGASGLVGNKVLNNLLIDPYFDRVIIFVRKSMPLEHFKLRQIEIDFDDLTQYSELIVADVAFCCIGTTIKKAGSKEAFLRVDYDYPLQFAEILKRNGCGEFILISSLGADRTGSNFYLSAKGKIEFALEKLKFKKLVILRPSMLLGERTEFRMGEKIGKFVMYLFSFIFIGRLKRYKAIEASRVAKAMVCYSKEELSGVNVFESEALQQFI